MCPEDRSVPVPLAQCKRRTGSDPASLTLRLQVVFLVFIFSIKRLHVPAAVPAPPPKLLSTRRSPDSGRVSAGGACPRGLVWRRQLLKRSQLCPWQERNQTQTSGPAGESGPSAATTAGRPGLDGQPLGTESLSPRRPSLRLCPRSPPSHARGSRDRVLSPGGRSQGFRL